MMLMGIWTVCGFALAAAPASRPSIQWEKSELGETAYPPMQAAPFPHPSRDKGHKRGKEVFPRDPHYIDNTVGLFIPRGYRKGEKTDVLVYLHGWGNNVRKAMVDFKLREQIVASGQNVILIFPEGPKEASDSGCGKLEDADGLRNLVTESLGTLHAEGRINTNELGRVLLAGHSGAYQGMSFCVEHGGLDKQLADVGLLDASYDNLDKFVTWVEKHPRVTLFSIFTDHLSTQNVYLMTHIEKAGQPYVLKIDTDATDNTLAKTRVLFLHTETLKHNDTVQWLEKWLRTRNFDH